MTVSRTPYTEGFGQWHIALLGAVALASIAAVAGFRAVLADWSFMVAAVIAGVTAATIIGAAWSRRLLIGETVAVAAIAMIIIGTIATNGIPTPDAFRSFFDGLINGWADVLSQTPPLDVTAERRVLPFSLAWIGTVIGGELVRRTGAPVLSTIGPLTALAVSVLVTAEDRRVGVVQGMVIAVVALGVGFAQSRTTADRERQAAALAADDAAPDTDDDESSAVRGRRRLVRAGVSLMIIAVVAPLAGPRLPFASANERFDLRDRNEPPWDPLLIPSPLVGLKAALKDGVRDDVVFTVQSETTIERFDLAVLGAYNGVVWTVGSTNAADPRLEFRPVGSQLPPAPSELTVPIDERSATITIEALDGPWLPTLGWPTAVSFPDRADTGAELRMNLATGTLAVPSGIDMGLTYELEADLERRPADTALADLAVAAQVDIDDDDNVVIPGAIRNIAADVLEGADRGWEQLQSLENKFVTDGFYDTSPESRPGHSYYRLAQFLAESDRLVGFEEQYVAAAATISQLAQLPTRVVVGYLVPASRYDADGVAEVLSSDISAWIEVDFGTSGWITVDVTPDRSREPVAEAVGKTIEDVAVPSPPPPPQIPPDPEVFSNEEEPEEAEKDDDEDEEQDDDAAGSTSTRIAGLVAGSTLIVLVALLAIIAAWKILRRRRRRNTPVAAASIGWAWRETLDRYDEAGISLPKTATPQEALRVFLASEPAATAAETDLRSMVSVVQRSAYHSQPPDASAGDQAWTYYDGVSLALREQRSFPRRARMLCDPRALRRGGWNDAVRVAAKTVVVPAVSNDRSASPSADTP